MPHSERRISNSIGTAYGQVVSIDNRLQKVDVAWGGVSRGQYLGVDPAKMANLNTNVGTLKTTVYPAYLDPAERHTVIGENGTLQTLMNDIRLDAMPILDFVASNPLADHNDEVSFNIVLTRNRKDPSHRTTVIEVNCVLAASHHGVGSLHCSVRTPDDAIGRTNIPHEAGADCVELAFRIVPRGQTPDDDLIILNANDPDNAANLSSGVHVVNPDTLERHEFFTRSQFHFHLGGDHVGQWVEIFPRWYNSHYPHFAGPWGERITMMIS